MGIRTEVDQIPAITLGAPSIGFTPLEMTYAFNTIANDGQRAGGSLDSVPGNKSLDDLGPTAIQRIVGPDGDVEDKNEVKEQRVLDSSVASTMQTVLQGPVSSGGTGEDAQTPGVEWGKTGTTENHGDAWFCGGTEHLTACVWVGHAMNNTPMETEYNGEPVAGGTYPAQIWGSVMTALEDIYAARLAERESESDDEDDDDDSVESSGDTYVPPVSSSPAPSGGGSTGGGGGGAPTPAAPAPAAPAPSGGAPTGGTGGTGL
jgi:penicillin-binding protein 1A